MKKAVISFEDKQGRRNLKEIELKDNYHADIPESWGVVVESCYVTELEGQSTYIPALCIGGAWSFLPF